VNFNSRPQPEWLGMRLQIIGRNIAKKGDMARFIAWSHGKIRVNLEFHFDEFIGVPVERQLQKKDPADRIRSEKRFLGGRFPR